MCLKSSPTHQLLQKRQITYFVISKRKVTETSAAAVKAGTNAKRPRWHLEVNWIYMSMSKVVEYILQIAA